MPASTQIVCPHCDTHSRIESSQLDDRPTCCRCHKHLFTGAPIELSSSNFYAHITGSQIPLLVNFWAPSHAPWCEPCTAMVPAFKSAARVLELRVRLGKVDIEQILEVSAEFQICSIPTLIYFKDGREIARHEGRMIESDIVRWAEGILRSDHDSCKNLHEITLTA